MLRILWWVSVTPFGEPVVPLVNWMLMASSNCRISPARRAARDAARRPCRATSSNAMVPGHFGPPIWITWRSCGSFAARRRPGSELGKLRHQRVDHLHVVRGLERGRGDDRGAADLVQREFELGQAIGGIDGDEDQPGLGGGELRQRPFRAVQRPDADPFAALQAEREEARGQRVDALGEFGPGPAHIVAWRDQRLAIAPALRRPCRGCGRWFRPATAHRKCRKHKSRSFRSSRVLHASLFTSPRLRGEVGAPGSALARRRAEGDSPRVPMPRKPLTLTLSPPKSGEREMRESASECVRPPSAPASSPA